MISDNNDSIGTELGLTCNELINNGSKIMYISGTPWYTDYNKRNHPICSSDEHFFCRSLATQMKDGNCPNISIEFKQSAYNLIDRKHDTVFGDVPSTRITKKQFISFMDEWVVLWMNDGCPKTAVKIPAGNSEQVGKWFIKYMKDVKFPSHIATQRDSIHPVCVDLTKNGEMADSNNYSKIENDKDYAGRSVDVYVFCKILNEGTDIPSLSHIYIIGLISNIRLLLQILGRVIRNKHNILGYEEWFGLEWLTHAKIVFMIPECKQSLDHYISKQLLEMLYASEYVMDYAKMTSINSDLSSLLIDRVIDEPIPERKSQLKYIMSILNSIDNKFMSDMPNTVLTLYNNMYNIENYSMSDILIDIAANNKLTDDDKSQAYIFAFNNFPDDIKELITAEELLEKIMTKINRIPSNNDYHISVIMREVLEEVAYEFKDVKIENRLEANIHNTIIKINGGKDIDYWTTNVNSGFNERESIRMLNDVIKFINKHGKYPCLNNSADETMLYRWLDNTKQAKRGNGNATWHPSLEMRAIKAGFPDMFNVKNNENETIEKCKKFINFTLANTRYPSKTATDKYEQTLYTWGNRLGIMYRKGSGIGGHVLYKSVIDMIQAAGMVDLFDITDNEQKAIDKFNAVINYVTKHNKYPTKRSLNNDEKRLAYWLSDMRKKDNTIYDSIQNLLNHSDYPNMCNCNWRVDLK
jgi:hypothetical protein